MDEKNDIKHTSEFGEIKAFTNTKYWFKRDFKTIKKSFYASLKSSPIIFTITLAFSFLITITYSQENYNIFATIVFSIILFPIFLFGYFMFCVMATKGYDIDPYVGTHIKTEQYTQRFSPIAILKSDMSKPQKALYLFRLIIFIALVIGLILNTLM
ncbi:hypothetical protein C4577_07050 [Candidatus Parcubacteria bacterium]|nr:MAG: hypothetical protein C4577_07050 [Candidatus Parcubacteria bacterium]